MSTPHAWEAAAAQLAGLRDLWPADVPRTLDEPIPDGSVIDYLRKWSTERPDAVAIHFYGRDITFAELDRSSAAYAGWLRANGMEPGDRAGVFLPNCPQCDEAYTYESGLLLACPMCGHEWERGSAEEADDGDAEDAAPVIRDSVGNVLADGDTVTVSKDLKIKGGGGGVVGLARERGTNGIWRGRGWN